jgi:hypothetical protein
MPFFLGHLANPNFFAATTLEIAFFFLSSLIESKNRLRLCFLSDPISNDQPQSRISIRTLGKRAEMVDIFRRQEAVFFA